MEDFKNAIDLKINTKPFLKWVGGKRQLLEKLKEYAPDDFNVYHEPMVGGGALFFELQPEKAVLNDYNKDLIRTYKVIRDDIDELIDYLKEYESNHNEDFYYQTRDEYNELKKNNGHKHKVELAAKLMYMNKTCFNGLYRVNQKGEFNVPHGKYKSPNICNEELIRNANEVLQGIELLSGDFEKALDKVEKNDFVYIDPPYDPVSDTADFTSYTNNGFGKESQKRLAETFKELHKRGAKVMLSNSDTKFIRELYKDFNIHIVQAKRYVNCKGNGRGDVNELIITNY